MRGGTWVVRGFVVTPCAVLFFGIRLNAREKWIEMSDKGEKILIGKVTKAFGIFGEAKIENYSGFADGFELLEDVFLDDEKFVLEEVKHRGRMTMLKFRGCDTRNDAEKLVGRKIYMTEDNLRKLPDDEFYVRDLIGMEVFCRGEKIGRVKDVLTDRPQDLYVISLIGGDEAMVPAVKEFIKSVDVETGKIDVELIEGMI